MKLLQKHVKSKCFKWLITPVNKLIKSLFAKTSTHNSNELRPHQCIQILQMDELNVSNKSVGEWAMSKTWKILFDFINDSISVPVYTLRQNFSSASLTNVEDSWRMKNEEELKMERLQNGAML